MFFGNRNKLGRAIDLAGGGVDNFLDLMFSGGLEDVQGSFDICVHIGDRGMIGVGDGNQGCQMKNNITTLPRPDLPQRDPDISGKKFPGCLLFSGKNNPASPRN